ncbi:hypothetical protein RRF57_009113 [Xylaria bambusicola]|uniref:Uncharacterized protein n=1 Tax=Xylaria bambusicola TaxID=326684 RepID=A0AAN7UT56_9PEZI
MWDGMGRRENGGDNGERNPELKYYVVAQKISSVWKASESFLGRSGAAEAPLGFSLGRPINR